MEGSETDELHFAERCNIKIDNVETVVMVQNAGDGSRASKNGLGGPNLMPGIWAGESTGQVVATVVR